MSRTENITYEFNDKIIDISEMLHLLCESVNIVIRNQPEKH